MAKKKVDETVLDRQENLAIDVMSMINKQFKDIPDKAAHFVFDDLTTDVTDWIDTGCPELNLAISNRPNGGFPVGRITEIYGATSSGKSLLASYAVKNTIEKGGIPIYFDTEFALNKEFWKVIGVDTKKAMSVTLDLLEDVFETMENIIAKVRATDKNKLITFVVDSIMGGTTKNESVSDFTKGGWNTEKSIVCSQAMRKLTPIISRHNICVILINQVRTNLGVTFGDDETTSGGKAIAFHSTVRIKLKSKGKNQGEINGIKTPVGIKVQAEIVKNKLGPPLRTVIYDIDFSRGINPYSGWLDKLSKTPAIKADGSWYTVNIVDETTGEEVNKRVHGEANFMKLLEDDPYIRDLLYTYLCKTYIMKYNDTSQVETTFTEFDEDE